MKKAETLEEIHHVTEPKPLEGDELNVFYVQTDAARDHLFPFSIALRDYLYETPPPVRMLFASHRGAGKSTELNCLMSETADRFYFVYVPVATMLDLATITHVDLIIALMEKLYEEGRSADLIKDQRVIEPVRGWLSEVVRETKVAREEDLTIEGGAGIDGLLAQIIGVFAKLRSAFKISYEAAQTIRQTLQPRIPALRQYCNQVIDEIISQLSQRPPHRRLLVIVEDTDKLDVDVARNLFVKHSGLLADLQASSLYTVPLFLINSPDYKWLEPVFEIRTLPMIKLYRQNGERFEPGWQVLRDIVARRLDVQRLIEPAALDMAIEKTGGVLRDLLYGIQRASDVARYTNADRISSEAMRHALDFIKSQYSRIVYGNEKVPVDLLYAKMQAIAAAPLGRVPSDDALQLLLSTQAVLEYNGRGWYNLHPLMRELLDEMGYLP